MHYQYYPNPNYNNYNLHNNNNNHTLNNINFECTPITNINELQNKNVSLNDTPSIFTDFFNNKIYVKSLI